MELQYHGMLGEFLRVCVMICMGMQGVWDGREVG